MWQRLSAAIMVVMMPAIAWAALDGPSGSDLPPPTGPVVLKISGNISRENSDGIVKLDWATLESIGVTTLRTTTVWTVGEVEFEGVLARDVMEAVGARGSEVVATALNDYAVTLPLEELYQYPVLLAFKMNGEYLQVRDKGPLWIVYPRDQFPELRNSMTDKKWVWQLSELEVR
jgi:hypothetical protein